MLGVQVNDEANGAVTDITLLGEWWCNYLVRVKKDEADYSIGPDVVYDRIQDPLVNPYTGLRASLSSSLANPPRDRG